VTGYAKYICWLPHSEALCDGARGRNLSVRHRFEARNLDGKSIWDVPDSWGVYILRDRKFNVSYVGSTPALRTKLHQHLQSQDIPEAKYFECYQVENERDAVELLDEIRKTRTADA
jgi:hypothetical protein